MPSALSLGNRGKYVQQTVGFKSHKRKMNGINEVRKAPEEWISSFRAPDRCDLNITPVRSPSELKHISLSRARTPGKAFGILTPTLSIRVLN